MLNIFLKSIKVRIRTNKEIIAFDNLFFAAKKRIRYRMRQSMLGKNVSIIAPKFQIRYDPGMPTFKFSDSTNRVRERIASHFISKGLKHLE